VPDVDEEVAPVERELAVDADPERELPPVVVAPLELRPVEVDVPRLEVDAVLELTVEVDAVAVPALATTVNITWSVLLRYAPALSSTVT
jgi:hypothetical protein